MKKIIIFLVALSFLAVPLNVFAGDPINVASKGFTEQVILGKIMATLLQDRGIPVKDRTSLGGTNVCREALEQGQIDVYMEYTGTAWLTFFKKRFGLSPGTSKRSNPLARWDLSAPGSARSCGRRSPTIFSV